MTTRKRPVHIDEDVMTGDQVEEIVAATCGFSGEDINDLMVVMQQAAYASVNKRLDVTTAWRVVLEVKARLDREDSVFRAHRLSYLDCDVPQQELTFV